MAAYGLTGGKFDRWWVVAGAGLAAWAATMRHRTTYDDQRLLEKIRERWKGWITHFNQWRVEKIWPYPIWLVITYITSLAAIGALVFTSEIFTVSAFCLLGYMGMLQKPVSAYQRHMAPPHVAAFVQLIGSFDDNKHAGVFVFVCAASLATAVWARLQQSD